ncbi:thioredoxin family protein [Actinoplanes sp. NBRC 103695]|uniref:thioredoxin family protein n=1 Tax=Actinoplanes sp. NBRC 103695 TaxID=3032202 RepID=UPI0024A3F835|nr:thioredoxin family protein [Actinoplanes sp. NBRC 103695]GLY98310.1 thioredoxin [Actinoplanes sp. NBRC 103695]
MPDDLLKVITDATFTDEVLLSTTPVLVDFWADWCPHCPAMSRTLSTLAPSFEGRITFTKINSDQNPSTTRDYRVMSLPTVLLFQGGRPTTTIVGARPASHIRAALTKALEPYVNS